MHRSPSIGRSSVRAVKAIQRRSSSSKPQEAVTQAAPQAAPLAAPQAATLTGLRLWQQMFSNILKSNNTNKAKELVSNSGNSAWKKVKNNPTAAVGTTTGFVFGYSLGNSRTPAAKPIATPVAAPLYTAEREVAEAKAAAAKASEARDAATASARDAAMYSAKAELTAAAVIPAVPMIQESPPVSSKPTPNELQPMLVSIDQAIEELRDETRMWREVREEKEERDMEKHKISSPRMSNRHLLKHMTIGSTVDACTYTSTLKGNKAETGTPEKVEAIKAKGVQIEDS